jgi:hypothetical protein
MLRTARPISAHIATVLLVLLAGCGKTQSAKTDDGKSTPAKTSPGPNAKTPADVKAEPIALKDFPMPEGVKLSTTFAETRTIMMRGPNKLDAYRKFYEDKLGGQGWKKNAAESETVAGVGYLKLDKGKRSIGITFNPSKDGKTITIMAQGSGVLVPKEKEGDGEE